MGGVAPTVRRVHVLIEKAQSRMAEACSCCLRAILTASAPVPEKKPSIWAGF
jgi:hypothetical protein